MSDLSLFLGKLLLIYMYCSFIFICTQNILIHEYTLENYGAQENSIILYMKSRMDHFYIICQIAHIPTIDILVFGFRLTGVDSLLG